MTDKGDLMSIAPGELSKMFIGSKNMILSAIKLGSPSEIGIIYSSTYELEQARTISTVVPYLYSSEEEAKAKLIDKNLDYNSKPSMTDIKNLELDKANLRVAELVKELNELKDKYDGLNQNFNQHPSEEISALLEQIESLKSDLTKEKESNTELTGYRVKFETLQKEIDENYLPKIKDLELISSETETLKDGLDKALKQIEGMKSDFNTACRKFKLNKVEGEWIQEQST